MEVIAAPVGVEAITGSAQLERPEHFLTAGALMAEFLMVAQTRWPGMASPVLPAQQDSHQPGPRVVAVNHLPGASRL